MSVLAISRLKYKVKRSILIFFIIAVGALFLLFLSPAPEAYAVGDAPAGESSSGDS